MIEKNAGNMNKINEPIVDKVLSIIVLNWNRKNYTQITMENLLARTTIPHEFIFVDNNSDSRSGVREYLKSIKGNPATKDIKYIFNSRNLGVAGGRNSGMAAANGDYLMTIDDDVVVPNNYDIQMTKILDNIPKVVITGVSVEPKKYPLQKINGIDCRPKDGNLGGACLCLSKKIVSIIGYYNYFSCYGHEDAAMYYRLKQIGLISVYIPSQGRHLDTDNDLDYRKEKDRAHIKGSIQLNELSRYLSVMRKTGDVYVPFNPNYIPADEQFFTNELILDGRKKK